ncbi:hypothetical protein FIU93_23025 [Labrenzia sp. THAF35]|uniref:XRE family transcriptional regulator n=1 Tax=Labrenzia sp. THAF35 TaxID=2587854 RepID=UPI0012A855F3|nr:XRE family transcriptional regulator [Labrenzia sp. THAF35]QFT69676.1 hypothetical protein FIU93_23025 [Labrenzia sp. THAF35]
MVTFLIVSESNFRFRDFIILPFRGDESNWWLDSLLTKVYKFVMSYLVTKKRQKVKFKFVEVVRVSRLSKMIEQEQSRRGLTEREISTRWGWGQQTFNTWKKGSVPRPKMYKGLADFLRVSTDDIALLAKEASVSTGSTKLPNLGSPIYGRQTPDGSLMFDDEAIGFAQPNTKGCYAIRTGGHHLWVNPNLRPVAGNLVVVRNQDGTGELAEWPVDAGKCSVHVVVLKEMV